MSDEVSAQDSQQLLTLLLRLLKKLFGNRVAAVLAWVLLGLGLLLVALRASMMFVPLMESQANEWLRERLDVHLFGLHGRWYGFTPQLRIESILFRHGSIEDIRVELDLVGSLLARSPRVKDLSFGHATIEFPPDFDLIGFLLNPQGQLDLMAMLGDARVLSGNLDVRVEEDSQGLLLDWHMQSRGANLGQIRLAPAGNEGSEGIIIGYDLDQGLLNRRIEGAIWAHGQLNIPDAFTSLIGVSGEISSLDAEIRIVGGHLSAVAEVRARALRVGNYLIDNAEFLAKATGTPWLVQGELERAILKRESQSLDLAGTLFSYDEHQRWRFNLPDQSMQRLASFVVASGRGETLLVRWSERFAPTGNLLAIAAEKAKGKPFVLSARVENLSAVSWMGSPELEQVDAQVVFASGAARVLVESATPDVGLPRLFDQSVALARTSGEVWVRFLPRYFGMRAVDLRSVLPGGGEAVVNLSYSGPALPHERQIAARLEGYGVAATDSLKFLPRLLPEGMKNWLRRGVREGVIEAGEILLSGYIRRQPPLPTMQVEMWLDWLDGAIAFHPRWPEAQAVSGRLELTGRMIHGQVEYAELLGAPIKDLSFEMPMRGPRVSLSDTGQVSAEILLELIESTPIAGFLPVNLAVIDTEGDVNYKMSTSLPLAFRPSDIEVELELDLGRVDVKLPQAIGIDAELAARQLRGELTYRFPDEFTSEDIQSYLFGQPASLILQTGETGADQTRRIQAEVRSHIDHGFLNALVGQELPLAGESGYAALIEIDPQGQASPRIRVHSELLGMEAQIPGGLGKLADDSVPLLVDVSLGDGGRSGEAWFSLAERVGGVLAWKHVNGSDPELGGSLVLGPDHSAVDVALSGESGLRILGGLPELSLAELMGPDSPANKLPLPEVRFEDFKLDRLQFGDFFLDKLSIEGSVGRDSIDVGFEGERLRGTWRVDQGGIDQLDFARIHLQSTREDEAGVGELIGGLDLTSLPEVDLSIASLKIAEKDYGSWNLGLRQIEDGVRLVNIEAEARGLSIRAKDDLIWRQLADGGHETRFVGDLATDDLADAMVGWGFAPSVEAERAQLAADLTWFGVPWQPEIDALNGEIDLTIRRGRFRDFDPGAGMKLLSLLDFNAFIRRLTLDFSDVFGEGVAFDEVQVKSQFEDGLMTMLEPAKIDGNGGRFRISGSINLETQELDNQLEATLKISRSLPWLAAYLALLGNPVTGLSVVVVERVMRDRIEDVSTARYYVTGTLAEPVFSLTEVEEPEPLPETLLDPESSGVEPVGDGESDPADDDATERKENAEPAAKNGDPAAKNAEPAANGPEVVPNAPTDDPAEPASPTNEQ